MQPLRRAALIAWRSRKIWFLQFVLTPILLTLAVAGLIIPEAHIWQLLLTGLLAVTIPVAFFWMQSATLVYFADYHSGEERPDNAFKSVWQTLAPFAACALLLATCLYLLSVMSDHLPQFASYLRSIMPAGMRRVLTEMRVDRFFAWTSWLIFWALPGFFLPMGLQIAKYGVHGLSSDGWDAWSRMVFSFRYWLIFVLFVIVGACIPHFLVDWHPKMSSLRNEAVSLGLRFLLAWFLAVTAWFILTSAVGWFNAERATGTSLPVRSDRAD